MRPQEELPRISSSRRRHRLLSQAAGSSEGGREGRHQERRNITGGRLRQGDAEHQVCLLQYLFYKLSKVLKTLEIIFNRKPREASEGRPSSAPSTSSSSPPLFPRSSGVIAVNPNGSEAAAEEEEEVVMTVGLNDLLAHTLAAESRVHNLEMRASLAQLQLQMARWFPFQTDFCFPKLILRILCSII